MLRGRLQYKYHYCGRCGRRVPLEEMRWEAGVLVCKTNDCQDTMLPQERDAMMDRAVMNAQASREDQPDPKISEAPTLDTDEISFMP